MVCAGRRLSATSKKSARSTLPTQYPLLAKRECTYNVANWARMRTSLAEASEELGGFFRISLSSLRIWFSKRRHSFSRAKSACGADTRSVGRYYETHLPSVGNPTPRSATTRRRDNQLVKAIRPASCLKSSVCFIISLVSLYECLNLK